MNHFIKTSMLAFAILSYAGSAQAMDPYIGVSLGGFNIGNGINKKMVGGGYVKIGDNFSDILGAEFRIGATGKTGEEFPPQASDKIDWFAAAFIKPHYDFTEELSAYALIGLATVRSTHTEPAFASQSKTRTSYAYGLGIDYKVMDQISINGELGHMLSKPTTSTTAIKTNYQGIESSVYSIGINYHFY